MKKIIIITLLLSNVIAFGKSVVKEIIVEGQCGECKERIEKALDKPGISFATWDVKTKVLTVRYNDKKFAEDDIHKIISELGYATNKLEANIVSEKKLPGCCQPKGVCKHPK